MSEVVISNVIRAVSYPKWGGTNQRSRRLAQFTRVKGFIVEQKFVREIKRSTFYI
jgi:hypothetical protein